MCLSDIILLDKLNTRRKLMCHLNFCCKIGSVVKLVKIFVQWI